MSSMTDFVCKNKLWNGLKTVVVNAVVKVAKQRSIIVMGLLIDTM